MIVHIVFFKWKKEVSKEEIENTPSQIKNLGNKIKGLKEIIGGENFSEYSKGFTHAIVVFGESRETLEEYRKHPEHISITKTIELMEEDSTGFDFEA